MSTCRCSSCFTELKSSTERQQRKCNACARKKKDTSSAVTSIALVAVGAAIGFIGGFVASYWNGDDKNTPKDNESETKQNEPQTLFDDPDTDIASCPICYDRKINIALGPCGHTLCDECTEELPTKLCPMCSKTISSTQKIFIN
eukprot:250573_1